MIVGEYLQLIRIRFIIEILFLITFDRIRHSQKLMVIHDYYLLFALQKRMNNLYRIYIEVKIKEKNPIFHYHFCTFLW